jgi:hypothetical protein
MQRTHARQPPSELGLESESEWELEKESQLGTELESERASELETASELGPELESELELGSDLKWVSDLVGLRKTPLFLLHRTR